jgi:hypothetical protein
VETRLLPSGSVPVDDASDSSSLGPAEGGSASLQAGQDLGGHSRDQAGLLWSRGIEGLIGYLDDGVLGDGEVPWAICLPEQRPQHTPPIPERP